ncbi:MAG: hypothetical protein ACXVB9_14815 [Bdellovibrionota bacterium]
MRWQKDAHFMEALYVVFVAFCLVALSSCAHDPKLSKQIHEEASAQPVLGTEARAEMGEKVIQQAPNLTDSQKAKLEEITLAARTDITGMREEEAKLRLLLVKQLVNPQATDREIEGIKERILELSRKSDKRWVSALDEARQVIGRKTEQDTRFYRAFMQEPIAPDLEGGRTEK